MSGGKYLNVQFHTDEIVDARWFAQLSALAKRLIELRPDHPAARATVEIVNTIERMQRDVASMSSDDLCNVWDALDRFECGDDDEAKFQAALDAFAAPLAEAT